MARTYRATLLAWAVGCLSPWVVPAVAAAEVVGLPQLERLALQPGTAQAELAARERGARAESDKARSAYYPRVGLKADSTVAPGGRLVNVRDADTNEKFVVPGSRTLGDGTSALAGQLRHSLVIDARGTLYDFGRTASAVAAARAAEVAQRAQAGVLRAQTTQAVQAAYLAWLTAHQLAALAEQVAREAEQRTVRMGELIDKGVRPRGELSMARADELLARLERERARSDVASAQLNLERVVGASLPADPEPDLALLSAPAAQATAHCKDADAVAQALQKQRDAAQAVVRMHRKERAPELATALSAGVRAQATTAFPIYSAGLVLTWPLYDGGVGAANVAAARAQAEVLETQLLAHEAERKAQRRQTDLDLAAAVARLVLAEELLATSSARLAEADTGHGLGVFSLEHVGQARALVRRAQTEVLLAKVARASAHLQGVAATNSPAGP